MHHIGYQRLAHQLQRFAAAPAPGHHWPEETDCAAHDMLVMSSCPDLTPEFPAGLRHPTQDERRPSHPRP